MDFLKVAAKTIKQRPIEVVQVYPSFFTVKSKDLMIRGNDFYAIWDPDKGMWSQNQDDVISLVDRELKDFADDYSKKHPDVKIEISYLRDLDSGYLKKWKQYVQKLAADHYHQLDTKITFANTEVKRSDYVSKRLSYNVEKGDHSAWDKLVDTLYSESERRKIEWAIGSIVTGNSPKIQKFFVFYGAGGTGKSTILNIIQMLFEGYWSPVDSKSLGMATNAFALEQFKTNPLIAVDHEGNLSQIKENSLLNVISSHDVVTVNEKFKSPYASRINAMLFIGTNKPVRITDAKSGLLRRLIDIHPTGEILPEKVYNKLMKQIPFQLGAIAYHCEQVYEEYKDYYNHYIADDMMDETNDFYNFLEDHYDLYSKYDQVTLSQAWEDYKQYCEYAKVQYPYPKRQFKSELKNYFDHFNSHGYDKDGNRVWNVFTGFRTNKFQYKKSEEPIKRLDDEDSWLIFKNQESLFDKQFASCPAQYAVEDEETGNVRPQYKWDNCKTTLKDIDTTKQHYVMTPEQYVMFDYDMKGEDGKKSFQKNFEAASKMPPTYAELSRSGSGIHLIYRYDGDVTKVSNLYSENVEIKTFPNDKKSAMRRLLTKCNDIPIAKINSGLPLKGEKKKVINQGAAKTEADLQRLIAKALKKEINGCASTRQSIDFIYMILEDAYNNGVEYDLTKMKAAVNHFAGNSTHQAAYCMAMVPKMHFKSEEISQIPDDLYDSDGFYFFDIEVFKNFLCVCIYHMTQEQYDRLLKMSQKEIIEWFKKLGPKDCVKLINPGPNDISVLLSGKFKLIGFNCRRYDNHVMYGRSNGFSNMQCYRSSKAIINNEPNCFFGNAYDVSYTDVFDFCAKKQSLKKWEIEYGFYHLENEYDWDEPLDKSHWEEVTNYCCNDVIATAVVFILNHGDFVARQILSALSGLNVNATTNQHTTRIIFGTNKHPGLVYTDFRTGKQYGPGENFKMPVISEGEYLKVKDCWKDEIYQGMNPPKNCFPGYFLVKGHDGKLHNMYRGVDLGFGGYVYANPGMYLDGAITEDVASEHPHSIKELNLFGEYTQNFVDLMDARIDIKHKDYEAAGKLFGGKLAPYLTNNDDAKALSKALKIAINSVYGLTSASFDNAFRDARNINNIVALRGALFMKTVQDAVEAKGYHVIHIKTDSIKIEKPDNDILNFVIDMGHKYGYDFETEHTWKRICLVNNAVFIGQHGADDPDEPLTWEAVGAQFQIPYVFKTLFSHEEIKFEDMCETKSVSTALYLDVNDDLPDVTEYEAVRAIRRKGEAKTKKDQNLLNGYSSLSDKELDSEIAKGHRYSFVGKVGLFCPMQENCGAGELLRKGTDRHGFETYNAATGAKWVEKDKSGNLVEVNRWMEAEVVKQLGKEKFIDRNYYRNLVDEAIRTINKFGSFDEFVSEDAA